MPELPEGTVTFLFTDIEGSTRLWEQHPEVMRTALARHDALLTDGIQQHGGVVVKGRGEGDSFFAVFAAAPDALAAACALQQALLAAPWPAETPLRVRMALHTATADLREGDYYGPGVNRCARLRAVAHGGQVLLSQATCERVRGQLPEGAALRDLGAHRLKDLQQPEHLFQLLHPVLPADFPPLRSLEAFTHNLPVQLTRFIGREREIAEVKRLLANTHLLTLTGAGGCGKTRLALQVAADLVEEYADGVWLVELAALSDPALVPQTVAAALGVREEPGRSLTATLTDYLRPRHLLLVLDNCEHLLTVCAQVAETLLRACPNLRVLATSREGLGIGGEQTYRVPSLSLPDPGQVSPVESLQQCEAVQLFTDRATLGQPTFAVTEANAQAVAQVCQRLDGIPLAIELAAARVKVLPVEQIAQRLDDRFRLLTGGSRTALPRQQTLRALIDWSYNLLSEPERVLLRRLSVFAGGWPLDAAEAVCAGGTHERGSCVEQWQILDLLAQLVVRSLAVYEEQEGEARYHLLETIRQYSRERLLEAGETEITRGRHRDWFLERAEQAEAKRWGAESQVGMAWLQAEHDNLRAALGWCVANGESEPGLRLGGALWFFWMVRGHWAEARERLTTLLRLSRERTAARAKALNGLAAVASQQGDYETGQRLNEESLAIQREVGNEWGMACALNDLGVGARNQGDHRSARGYLEESLAISRRLGPQWGIACALNNLAEVALDQREYRSAEAFIQESLATWRAAGDQWGVAHSLLLRGRLARYQGDYGAARTYYRESLAIFHQVGDQQGTAWGLEGLAGIAAAHGQAARPVRLLGAASALRDLIGAPRPPADRAEYDRQIAAARARLSQEAFDAAWAEGQAMPPDRAIAFALEEASSA